MPTHYIYDTDTYSATPIHVADPSDDEVVTITRGTNLINTGSDFVITLGSGLHVGSLYVNNFGTVLSNDQNSTIYYTPNDFALYNGATGVIANGNEDGRAIYTYSDDARITNLGEIYGATAVGFYNSENGVLNNAGTITGTGRDANDTAISVYAYGSFADAFEVNNSGTIIGAPRTDASSGPVAFHIYGFNDGAGQQAVEFSNTGTVTGDIILGLRGDTVTNTGLIDGDVRLGADNDTFDGRGGTVTGSVAGGAGDDAYFIDTASIALVEEADEGTDTVFTEVSHELATHFENLVLLGAGDIDGSGSAYQNVITGNAGANVLFGNNSRDTIDGGAGADTIDGGLGGDVLNGDMGNDWIAGRSSDDYLDGGGGDDFLFGGIGDDSMFGDEGNDTLKGGGGSDTMDGGAGADTFVFTRATDSVGGVSDVIENFVTGEDILDFTGLIPGTLDVNILGGLTGGGQASLRTFENSYGDTIVFVDTDGDGAHEMRIEVNLVTGLTEGDFLV